MCGIFAIAAETEVSLELYKGLLALEYRGYDSCGIAVFNSENIKCRKNIGEVREVNKIENFSSLRGYIGIAHTRWATHGGVTRKNAHPHYSNNQRFIIAHNGIVSNYNEIKQKLLKKGYNFYSQTDTEVVVNLVQDYYDQLQEVEKAFLSALNDIEGSFTICLFSKEKSGIVYGVKKDSPLIIGIGKNKNYLSSDANAFVQNTKKVIYMDDGEYVLISKDKVIVKNLATKKVVNKKRDTLNWSLETTKKMGFSHFMLKEIFDQPQTIRNSMNIKEEELENLVKKILQKKQTFLIGVGTTYYVAMIGNYLFSQYAQIYTPAISSDEFNNIPHLDKDYHALFLSQSGETYDTREALKNAQQRGVATSGIVNVVGSSISRIVEDCVYQLSGPEISVVSTKAAISQIVILLRIALRVGIKRKSIDSKQVAQIEEGLVEFTSFLEQMLNEQSGKINQLAKSTKHIFNWMFLGRGIYYPIAMESALKMKEVTYLHSEGMSAGFLKHGSLAMVNENICSLFFLPLQKKQKIYESSLSALEEVKARGGLTMGFIEPDNPAQKLLDYKIYLPKIQHHFVPIYQLIMLQLFSYYSALALKRNIDKPRNLAKSVTVE